MAQKWLRTPKSEQNYISSINIKVLWREILTTIHSTFTDKQQKSLLLERWEELGRKYFVPYVCFTTHWRSVRRTLQVNIAWDSDNLQYTDNTDCRWPNYHYKHLLAPDSSPDAGGCHLLLNHVPEERLWRSYPGSCGIHVGKQSMALMQEFITVPV